MATEFSVIDQLERHLLSMGIHADEFRMGLELIDASHFIVTDQDLKYIVRRFSNLNYLNIASA